ncbi:MAG: hypothetical protein QNJ40_25785 [Xanthomonadales bacterium]|nr:hypothetical protein [Xanthomonadales bacterium]
MNLAKRILRTTGLDKRLFVIVALLLNCAPAFGDCRATTQNLTQIQVYSCNGMSMTPDSYPGEYGWLADRGTRGAMINARILQSRSVIRADIPPERYDLIYPQELPEPNDVLNVFVEGEAEEICPKFREQKELWVISRFRCCDTSPAVGICIVPFPVVEEEPDPERWAGKILPKDEYRRLRSRSENSTGYDPATCPFTDPQTSTDFVAPNARLKPGQLWHGNNRLAIPISANGWWQETAVSNMMFWFSDNLDGESEQEPELNLSVRRMDAEGPAAETSRTYAAIKQPGSWSIFVEVKLPTEGCWEVVGEYKGEVTRFVNRSHPPPG